MIYFFTTVSFLVFILLVIIYFSGFSGQLFYLFLISLYSAYLTMIVYVVGLFFIKNKKYITICFVISSMIVLFYWFDPLNIISVITE